MELKQQNEIIKELALKLKEISATPLNNEHRQAWADHNDLKGNTGPLLWICPDDDGAWTELVPYDSLKCEDSELRELELKLRRYLYQHERFKDDFVFEPAVYFNMPGEYTGYLYGDPRQTKVWGIDVVKKVAAKNAYHLDNFLKTDDDFETLLQHEVDFIPDYAELKRLKEKYEQAVDGVISVQFQLPYSVLVQSHLIELVHLRGLDNLMYDVYDYPELLNNVLNHMAVSKEKLLRRLEQDKILFDNRINIYTGSGSLGYTNDPRKNDDEICLKDMWGFADAQEFSNVSAEMFEHFAIKNQKIGLNLLGRGCYGCCEPLDDKYEIIFKHITNIRRLSVSPWSNVNIAAENIGKKAIFSWKPNPAKVCGGFDEDETKRWLAEVANASKDCTTEIILKDIRTCNYTDANIRRFLELVYQAFGRG